jgi:hypothetical protein
LLHWQKLGQFRKIIHQLEQEFTSKFRRNRILFRTFSKEYIDKVVALDLKLVPKKFQLKPFLRTAMLDAYSEKKYSCKWKVSIDSEFDIVLESKIKSSPPTLQLSKGMKKSQTKFKFSI